VSTVIVSNCQKGHPGPVHPVSAPHQPKWVRVTSVRTGFAIVPLPMTPHTCPGNSDKHRQVLEAKDGRAAPARIPLRCCKGWPRAPTLTHLLDVIPELPCPCRSEPGQRDPYDSMTVRQLTVTRRHEGVTDG
jgi:hypothetical protein